MESALIAPRGSRQSSRAEAGHVRLPRRRRRHQRRQRGPFRRRLRASLRRGSKPRRPAPPARGSPRTTRRVPACGGTDSRNPTAVADVDTKRREVPANQNLLEMERTGIKPVTSGLQSPVGCCGHSRRMSSIARVSGTSSARDTGISGCFRGLPPPSCGISAGRERLQCCKQRKLRDCLPRVLRVPTYHRSRPATSGGLRRAGAVSHLLWVSGTGDRWQGR
jgi:hypothetical protein